MAVRQTILENMKAALIAIMDDPAYETDIKVVSLFDENKLEKTNREIPMVMIVDEGQDAVTVEDDTHYRYIWEIGLYGLVRSETHDNLHEKLNKMISTLREFVESNPSLGSNVLEFKFLDSTSRYFKEEALADCLIHCRLTYWTDRTDF